MFDVRGAWQDVIQGLQCKDVWIAFAWDEIQNRYRRSVLGLAWLVVSYFLFVTCIATFFGGFSGLAGREFVVSVAFGYAFFAFMQAAIVDGCAVFSSAGGWVKSASLPYSIYVFKGLARNLFPLCIHLCCALVISPFFGWRPTAEFLLVLPAFFVILLTAIAVQYTLGLLAARMRDIGHLVQALARLLFFVTPILWVYEETGGLRRRIADVNPFTHFIEMVRDPIIGAPLEPNQWKTAILLCLLSWALYFGVAGLIRRKLPFWV